jgi:response regulator RpfG family c-di-GMP phosphodiesterase
MTPPPGWRAPISAERPSLLIVDDEPNIRALLVRALSGGAYRLAEAASGEDALAHFRAHGADLILSDLLMPGMSGIDLLSEVKAIDESVGFLILTGAGSIENAVEALRRHADDYLLKPFNLDEVGLAVERALRHRRLVQENRYYQLHLEERVREQAQQIEDMFVDALLSLANAIDARDGYTGGHVERVTRYAVATGTELGMPPERLRHLWVGALLHDVGKIGVPDEILNKPGKLTTAEYAIMKKHPEIGAAILERSNFLQPALPGVLHHQEKWDGTGYPFGLRGEEISLEGRVLAVVDTFDAIITSRPYRALQSVQAALSEIRRCSGSQFDPRVVEAFVRALENGFPLNPSVPALPDRATEWDAALLLA